MAYKHISKLDFNERAILFNHNHELIDMIIHNLVENQEDNDPDITYVDIKESFYYLVENEDYVVDLSNYNLYKRI